MNKDSKDSTTLVFKNIPKQVEDLTSLLNTLKIPAKEIKSFGRKRALISYEQKSEAELALDTLRELEFSGKYANISLFCTDKPKDNKQERVKTTVRKCHKSAQTTLGTATAGTTQTNSDVTTQQVNKYVQKLYAIEGELGFQQPPPPYLKYSYPPINKDILDNICISLLSNKRFYTQVLHLMNRMSLEPPFNKRNYKFTKPGIPREAGTQTDEVIIQEKPKLSKEDKQIEDEIESEWESSEDEVTKCKPQTQIKRKLPTHEEQYKKKARQMLQATQKFNKETTKRTTSTNLSIKEIFETPEHGLAATGKIELQLKRPPKHRKTKEPQTSVLILPSDLNTQKLTEEQLETLPIYKNYQTGAASNKLYIKNLHKDVSTEDLRAIYQRYITDEEIKLDIKVMQHGRMKGQAFVTFQGCEMDIIQPIIGRALEQTNGFMLRDKPMVVCYGKQS